MDLRFTSLELASLDALKVEVLCLFLFADERPPRGAPGLVDWRLAGMLSRLLASDEFGAAFDEALLMPTPARRLLAERLFVLGAGTRDALAPERARALVHLLLGRVQRMRVRTAAIALPHASLTWCDPAQAIEWLLEGTSELRERLDELIVIDTAEAQRAMEPRIEAHKRRVLAGL